MKKHENAIKALMKNVKDNEKWYGYFEDENGARYLMNMHIVIKLTGSTLDYVGELPRLDNIKLVKQFIDFIETFKKGEYSASVNVDDVKIFDKYKERGECFKQQYVNDKYIAFNPFYFCKLNILTGSDLLTITDSKSPMYIAGNDVECVLLPCSLDKNYNSDNYNDFKTLLQSYYKQDQEQKQAKQEQKALKNTDKIEKEVIYNGFTLYFASRQLFILSDKKRVTNDITNDFLEIMSDITGIDYINKITENDYKYYKSGVQTATITKTTSYYGNEEIYRIETKYNSENFYKNELDRLIIYNGNMEKIDILADDMSATDEETPKTATIQNNAADIVKADTVKDDTCTATDTAATKDINTDLKTIETPVILRYSDYEHIRIKKGYYINVRNYDYIIYQLQVTNEYRIYNLNYMMPYGCDDFKTVADAVNHLNDTADKQNEYYNIHNHYTKQEIYNIYASYNFYNKYELVKQYVEKDMQADARQDATPTQDKPHKTSKKAISLFVVTDKPQPVKLPHLKPLNNIPMYVERFKTDLQPLKSHRVYNTRVSNKKTLKKAHNDFIGTVSCYNDKCAIGGGSVAVNSS